MSDLISRQAAIDAVYDAFCYAYCDNCEKEMNEDLCGDCHRKYQNWSASKKIIEKVINNLPSAQPNEFRKQGEWDMFELITSAWYGKQYYFKEENGMAYSRKSHKTMTVDDAILEFMREIGDE